MSRAWHVAVAFALALALVDIVVLVAHLAGLV